MKSATIVLIALTLFAAFLEASSSPADSSGVAFENTCGTLNIEEILQKSKIIDVLLMRTALVGCTGRICSDTISNRKDKIKPITGLLVKVTEEQKQIIYKAIYNARAALVQANNLMPAAVAKAKCDARIPLIQFSVWLKILLESTITIQNCIKEALAIRSVKALGEISVATSVSVAAAKEDYAKLHKVLNGILKADVDQEMTINFDNADVINEELKKILSGKCSTSGALDPGYTLRTLPLKD